jgi:flagellin-like protein
MNLRKQLGTEERGVSPVIGVILMVAITVILAAVIGGFVLQLGSGVGDAAPQASIGVSDTNFANDSIELRHSGGDTIEWADTNVILEVTGSADNTVRWDSPNSDALSTGQRATIYTDGSASPKITLNTETNKTVTDTNVSAFPLEDNDKVTLTLIDRPSGEIISESEFRL